MISSELLSEECASISLLKMLPTRSYSDRISFYLQKIFSCEATGKNGMDYYTALNSERRERDVVNQRFPELLKGKVLKTIQYREWSFAQSEDLLKQILRGHWSP